MLKEKIFNNEIYCKKKLSLYIKLQCILEKGPKVNRYCQKQSEIVKMCGFGSPLPKKTTLLGVVETSGRRTYS